MKAQSLMCKFVDCPEPLLLATQSVDGEEGSDQTLEASPLCEHDQLKDAFADMYQTLNSWSNLHLSIYKLQ